MLLLQATRKDIDAAIAIFEELGSWRELGGMSVVVRASRPHIGHGPTDPAPMLIHVTQRLQHLLIRQGRL